MSGWLLVSFYRISPIRQCEVKGKIIMAGDRFDESSVCHFFEGCESFILKTIFVEINIRLKSFQNVY